MNEYPRYVYVFAVDNYCSALAPAYGYQEGDSYYLEWDTKGLLSISDLVKCDDWVERFCIRNGAAGVMDSYGALLRMIAKVCMVLDKACQWLLEPWLRIDPKYIYYDETDGSVVITLAERKNLIDKSAEIAGFCYKLAEEVADINADITADKLLETGKRRNLEYRDISKLMLKWESEFMF